MIEEPEKNRVQQLKTRGFRWTDGAILFSTVGVIVLLTVFYIAFMQMTTLLQTGMVQASADTRDLSQRLQQVNDEVTKQAQSLTELRQLQATHPVTWRVAEAHYLVKLANDQLQFMHNIPVAEKLLEAANNEVGNLNEPNVDSLRKALAQDMARLQSVQPVNSEDIYTRLVGLDEKLGQLPLPVAPVNAAVSSESKEDISHLPWWKRGLHQTWQSLQKIVVVQHKTNAQLPFVTLEQREFIYLNLHAKLETAIWGVLHHQPVVYQTSLSQITQWVTRYFVPDASLTQTVLATLVEMQKMNVQQPDVSVADSVQAFQSYLSSQPTS